mmetsp:Transcript_26770/g.30625  ORF Transcript_26770/g.30625 Transcript_26770/m.30625 type:complete len:217 (+) Transcript_26770:53-703(+)
MSNYSDIPIHIVFSSTVIIRTTDKDEDGVVHGCVVNDADNDDLSLIDDVSCMSEDNASLEHIRVGLYHFVVESTYNDLEDFGPPPVAVSTATKDGTGVDTNDNDNGDDDDEISAISKSSSIRDREVVITSSIASSFEKQHNTCTDCSAEEEEKSSIVSSYFSNKNQKTTNKRSVLLLSNDYHDDCIISISPTMIPLESFELGSDEEERNERSHHDN